MTRGATPAGRSWRSWREELFARRTDGIRFDLDAVRAVDAALGHPASGARIVQVVGTNGKGSTAAMIAFGLKQRGRRVGLFTSPHLHRIGERVRIDGEPVADDAIAFAVDRIRPHEGAAGRRLSFFELITLAAWLIFADAGVEDVVLEAGLGGRLDATSARRPHAIGVASIAMDHEAFLGGTLTAIAGEKAAVFRRGVPVVSGPQHPDARLVLVERAHAVGASLRVVAPERRAPDGLPGAHQAINLAVARGVLLALGVSMDVHDFDEIRWPARLERWSSGAGADVVFDVAHNEHGARALAAALPDDPRRIVVLGVRRDKRPAAVAHALEGVGSLWCAQTFEEAGRVEADRSFTDLDALVEAVRASASSGIEVVVTGSHRLVGPLRARLLGVDDRLDAGLSDPSQAQAEPAPE